LVRDKKRIRTTDAGRVLHQHAKRIFEELNSVEQRIAEIQGLVKGRLTIGCSDTVCMYVLNSILDRFIKKYPQIEITVRNKTSSEIVRLLTNHNIDIGITLVTAPVANLSCEPFLLYREVAVCSSSHPLAKEKSVDLKALSNYKLLVLEEGTQTRALLEQDFRQNEIIPSSIMEVGSVDVQKSFAAIDMGVAIVPDFAAEKERNSKRSPLTIISISNIPKRKLGILTKSKSTLSPVAGAFHSELKQYSRFPA